MKLKMATICKAWFPTNLPKKILIFIRYLQNGIYTSDPVLVLWFSTLGMGFRGPIWPEALADPAWPTCGSGQAGPVIHTSALSSKSCPILKYICSYNAITSNIWVSPSQVLPKNFLSFWQIGSYFLPGLCAVFIAWKSHIFSIRCLHSQKELDDSIKWLYFDWKSWESIARL